LVPKRLGAELSGRFGTSAEVSSGHFGTGAEVSWVWSVRLPTQPHTLSGTGNEYLSRSSGSALLPER